MSLRDGGPVTVPGHSYLPSTATISETDSLKQTSTGKANRNVSYFMSGDSVL